MDAQARPLVVTVTMDALTHAVGWVWCVLVNLCPGLAPVAHALDEPMSDATHMPHSHTGTAHTHPRGFAHPPGPPPAQKCSVRGRGAPARATRGGGMRGRLPNGTRTRTHPFARVDCGVTPTGPPVGLRALSAGGPVLGPVQPCSRREQRHRWSTPRYPQRAHRRRAPGAGVRWEPASPPCGSGEMHPPTACARSVITGGMGWRRVGRGGSPSSAT